MPKPVVRSSGVALAILEKIAFADRPLSQVDIAADLGMVKSAAHKHLHTLEEASWVSRDGVSGRYHLGPVAWLVGQSAARFAELTRAAETAMETARDETGLSVVLSAVSGRTLNVVATLPGTHAIEIGVRRGSALELHSSAQGQIALAFGDRTHLERVCKSELAALTPHTITRPDALRERVRETAKRGYAIAPEETLPGLNGIAAPVFDHSERLVATAALIGSVQHLAPEPDGVHVEALLGLSRTISRAQGHRVR